MASDVVIPGSRGLRLEFAMKVLTLACLLAVFLRVTVSAASPLSDPDTWWHLRVGDELWGSWSVTNPGRLSTFATSEWVPTQWSSEMLASKVEDWFGLPGIAWLFGVALVGFVLAVFVACRRESDLLPAVVATTLAVAGATGSLSSRPQVVSFILLAITVAAWLETSRDLKPRWWLVPLMWVWAGAHGLWLAGVLLGFACVFGLVLEGRANLRIAWRLVAVPLLSLAAAALTPVGPRLLLAPFTVNERAPMISEWQPTSFRNGAGLVVALMIGVLVVAWARRGSVPWSHISMLLMATGWTVLYARTVPLGAIIVAPLLAAAMQSWLPTSEREPVARTERFTITLGVVACILGLALAVPHTSSTPGNVPSALGPRLERLPQGTTVLNAFVLGGWIEWQFPSLNPVIDGLADAYPVDYFADYIAAESVAPGWTQFVAQSGARVAILEEGSPLAEAMQSRLHWKLVQVDNGYVLLEPPT